MTEVQSYEEKFAEMEQIATPVYTDQEWVTHHRSSDEVIVSRIRDGWEAHIRWFSDQQHRWHLEIGREFNAVECIADTFHAECVVRIGSYLTEVGAMEAAEYILALNYQGPAFRAEIEAEVGRLTGGTTP